MPTKTPHFGFQAFVSGDYYSATVDKARFTSIDQHMAFLSDVIGPGRVSGWVISQPSLSDLDINITPGIGLINRNITRTFGDYSKSLLDNNFVYVWIKRRPGVIGQAGAFSNIATYAYNDAFPPSVPTGFQASNVTVSSVLLNWDVNTDFDFSQFNIYRSLDNVNFDLLTTISDENEYLDADLEDDTTYYYKISSVDFSANESAASAVVTATTELDETPPSDPLNITVTPATNAIHLLWRPASFGTIEAYRAYVTPVNLENQPTGDTTVTEVPASVVYASILDLSNGQKYRVKLVSVGDNGIESSGVTLYSTPEFFLGPRDVVDLRLLDKESDGIVSDVVLSVEWDSFIDPYDTNPPVSHEIQIEEVDSANSRIIKSIWIQERNEDFRDFKIYPYVDSEGVTRNRSIRTRTVYFVTVRAIDADGNVSVGRIARHRTRTYEAPRPVSNLRSEQQEDQSIEFTWFNSTSIFKDNVIDVIRENSSNPSDSLVIEESKRVGLAQSYTVEPSLIEPGSTFRFTIKVVDEFENESASRDIVFDIPEFSDLPRPPVPSQLLGTGNDSAITLSWNQANLSIVSGYRIYRSVQQITYESSDFSRIETVDSSTFSYTDYDVENDVTYAYFITTIDIYGRESLNPIDDDFFDYNMTLLTPRLSGELGTPNNLSATVDGSGTGIDVTWDPTAGQFDGYEIYRSINNTFEFELVGTTSPSETEYNDEEALKISGTYYYIVRKFRNEADLFITESDIAVTGGLLIGTVETIDGEMTIDQSSVRNILDIEDPIREKAQEIISAHKHEFYTSIDDRRINLDNIIRVEDWITEDFQNYTTTADLSDTFGFEVYLNGQLAEEFSLLYNVDRANGRITFEQSLAPTDFLRNQNDDFPFDTPPELVVIFQGLTETEGELPQQRLEGLSARQVTIGLVEERQLNDIDHQGRVKEKLIPVQIETIAVDNGYRFAPISEDAIIGDAITWYDIILAEGDIDILVGSSSDGIYTSADFGASWTRRLSLVTPVIKFFYSESLDLYFALTNRGVFASRGGDEGGFSVWREIRGMENSKITRGIAETPDGDILCTSDLGVFKLVRDVGRDFYFWEQTPIFGPSSTECYDILYDTLRDRIIVSNELGVFETSNAGLGWTFSGEMPDQRPIFGFKMHENAIFCVTQFIVWRRKAGEQEFKRIAVLRDVDVTRKIEIWKNRIYLTTDKGLLASAPDSDIMSDEDIEFSVAFSQMNQNNYSPPPTSMSIVDDKMFVGSEEQLFLAPNPGYMTLQWEKRSNVIPTVYVDGVEQIIGFRYTTSTVDLRKFICFDEKQSVDAKVTVANQYKTFRAENGGWADANFTAGVQLFVNGLAMNDWSVCERPAQAIRELVLPEYNDRNSHKAGADLAANALVDTAVNLIDVGDDSENPILSNFTKPNVVIFLNNLDRFLSQIYPEARVVAEIIDGQQQAVPFEIPAFRVLLFSSTRDYRDQGLTDFGTYSDNSSLEEVDLGGPVSEEDTGGGIAPASGG